MSFKKSIIYSARQNLSLGAAMVEVGIVVALVSIAALVAIVGIPKSINSSACKAVNGLTGAKNYYVLSYNRRANEAGCQDRNPNSIKFGQFIW